MAGLAFRDADPVATIKPELAHCLSDASTPG